MKRVVSVSKTYKHRGVRWHRKNTKKFWHIYYYDNDFKFYCEQVSALKAVYYKKHLWHRLKKACSECHRVFLCLVKNKNDTLECPYCS